jgi:hypothetical protein
MTETLSSALIKNRTIKDRLQIFTDTDNFRELMRQYGKYGDFFYREIRENRAEITCKKDSIDIRMIPRPFDRSYKVATIEIESSGDFKIKMYSDPEQSQLEIDLFMQDLGKILQ